MKTILTLGALLTAATAGLGQGQFLFNTHDPSAGNDVKFGFLGTPLTGPDFFLQVLAGPDLSHLQPVTGTLGGPLPLNRPVGQGAGYSNPFSDIYTVPGMSAGQNAVVGYTVFRGTDYATGDHILPLVFSSSPVTLTEPPTPPNEVALGVQDLQYIPEPSTAALSLLAIALGAVTCRQWECTTSRPRRRREAAAAAIEHPCPAATELYRPAK